jgi:hypothetical protein
MFNNADEIRDWNTYKSRLKTKILKLKQAPKYARYFKRFVYGDQRARPLLLIGKKWEIDDLVEELMKGTPSRAPGAKASAEATPGEPVASLPKPSGEGRGFCRRRGTATPGTILFDVDRGKMLKADLAKLMRLATVDVDVEVGTQEGVPISP